jgi:hypothetical protein
MNTLISLWLVAAILFVVCVVIVMVSEGVSELNVRRGKKKAEK